MKLSIIKAGLVVACLCFVFTVCFLSGCSDIKYADKQNDDEHTNFSSPSPSLQPINNEGQPNLDNNSNSVNDGTHSSDKNNKNIMLFPFDNNIRPYAVMIDNEGTRVLPQGGLAFAQIIYEIIVEGGETRLMPVFWGTAPELIGPVRSSRHYFLDYSMEHDAIYIHFGYSPMAKEDLKRFKIDNINGVANGGEVFWDLTNDKRNWQDSYTSAKRIKDYCSKVKYRKTSDKQPVFSYSESNYVPDNSTDAKIINIRYSSSYTCSYEYDEKAQKYLRFRKQKPHMERNTGEQLTAENIIIQYVPGSTIKGDKYGRQQVDTVGKGEGYFITKGKKVSILWSKNSRTSPTVYKLKDGSSIKFNKGQMWIQIVPLSGKVEIKP